MTTGPDELQTSFKEPKNPDLCQIVNLIWITQLSMYEEKGPGLQMICADVTVRFILTLMLFSLKEKKWPLSGKTSKL